MRARLVVSDAEPLGVTGGGTAVGMNLYVIGYALGKVWYPLCEAFRADGLGDGVEGSPSVVLGGGTFRVEGSAAPAAGLFRGTICRGAAFADCVTCGVDVAVGGCDVLMVVGWRSDCYGYRGLLVLGWL